MFFSHNSSLIFSSYYKRDIPRIADCLKILTDEEVKNFVLINFGEYFKSMREKLYSKLSQGKNLTEVAGSF